MRPRQWVKNVLVLAAPFAAGELLRPGIALQLVIAFVAFSLAASGVYLVNDAKDVEADRVHPTKRNRPIAAGIVPAALAVAVAVVLLAGSIALALLASVELAALLAVYVVVQLAYCFWLKHQPVLDICIVASASSCAPSPAARPRGSRCRSGSCWWRASGRCSWWPASGTRR
jgi:decaprenyl-phosphate phosphoribosyltransferase